MGRLTDWICKYLRIGCAKRPEVDEVEALTRQFHVTLRAHITKVEETAADPIPKALERIREIAKKGDDNLNWQDAYDIEQQLVQLYDDSTLRIELERRLLDAEHSLHATVANWYRERTKELSDQKDLAALLSRLINDLQWRYTRNEARRAYTKEMTGRTEKVYALAFLLFVFVLLPPLVLLAGEGGVQADNLWLLPFVGLAGAFGAAFSMMTSLKKRLASSTFDDLKLNRSWGLIFARVLVGIGAGFILFFFVRSGLLGGDAFPDLSPVEGSDSDMFVKRGDFAKLFLSCFIAGFSERLVPNLLSRSGGRASTQGIDMVEETLQQAPARPVPPVSRQRGRSESDTRGEPVPTNAPEKQ